MSVQRQDTEAQQRHRRARAARDWAMTERKRNSGYARARAEREAEKRELELIRGEQARLKAESAARRQSRSVSC